MSGLSKSRIIIHRQCPKRLWLQVHWPELLETSDVTAARLTTGITVGEIARSLDPCGKLIGAEDIGQAIKATRDALKAPDCTIFEATFLHQAITLHFNPVRHFKFTEKRKTMPLSLTQIKSQFEPGESEGALLGKLQAISKEAFMLRKEQNGSPTPRASMTRKYLGSKGSKVVTHIDPRSGKVYGVTTTAESL